MASEEMSIEDIDRRRMTTMDTDAWLYFKLTYKPLAQVS